MKMICPNRIKCDAKRCIERKPHTGDEVCKTKPCGACVAYKRKKAAGKNTRYMWVIATNDGRYVDNEGNGFTKVLSKAQLFSSRDEASNELAGPYKGIVESVKKVRVTVVL